MTVTIVETRLQARAIIGPGLADMSRLLLSWWIGSGS